MATERLCPQVKQVAAASAFGVWQCAQTVMDHRPEAGEMSEELGRYQDRIARLEVSRVDLHLEPLLLPFHLPQDEELVGAFGGRPGQIDELADRHARREGIPAGVALAVGEEDLGTGNRRHCDGR